MLDISSCFGFGDVAAVTIFLFDVSMRWIGLRLDLMAGMMTVGTTLVLILTKGLISPASGGLVLSLCGKVRNNSEISGIFVHVFNVCEVSLVVFL